MKISLAGINHQTAPVEIREKLAVSSRKQPYALSRMKSRIPRGVILSTCNRTEIYTAETDSPDGKTSLDYFSSRPGITEDEAERYIYLLHDRTAVKHLFRVAGGLDSMVVGEYEVLGQVRQALAAAEKAGMVHLPLRRLFQSAVRAGRRIREETGISRHSVSVSSVAIELAARACGELANHEILVIGTGEAGKLVAEAAKDRGISRTVVIGRTKERAKALAERLGGIPVGMESLITELASADIVISCSDAPHYTLNVGQVKQAMSGRQETPLVIIDIAVPRNIEPAVNHIAGVTLYNIDDITRYSNEHLAQRRGEIVKAEQIIEEELEAFHDWRHDYEVRPVIKAIMSKAEAIRQSQFKYTLNKIPALTEEDKQRLEKMSKSIIKKVLSDPVSSLKNNGYEGQNYADALIQLFRLEVEDQG